MKRAYQAPVLVEFGALDQITLGAGGSAPDQFNGQNTDTNCPGQTVVNNGQTMSVTSCQLATS